MTPRRLNILRDRRGVAAIEFAFVLPILIVMVLGVIEVSQGIITYMKVIDVADTVSDLVSQQQTVASADLNNYYIAGQLVMTPSSGSGLGLAIASVTYDPTTGNPSIAWQVTRGGAAAITDVAATTLATGLGSPGDSVIIAQANYTYTSVLQYVITYPINMSSTVVARPRLAPQIPCTGPCT